MYFKSCSVENFMSFEKERINYESSDLFLLEGENQDEGGSNGSGKTSIVTDAPCFALFGETVRGLKGDKVIHRKFKKNCKVVLDVEFQAKQIKIVRHRKHSEFGDRFWIEIDGDKKEFGTLDQTQKYLEEFFGIDYDLFKCTVILAQEDAFNFVNETNKKQKEILSKIMRLSFDHYLSEAKTWLKDANQNKSKIEREILVLKSHVKDEETIYKKEIEEFEDKKKEISRGILNDMKVLKLELQELKSSIVEEIDTEELDKKIEERNTRLIEINSELKQLTKTINEYKATSANKEEIYKASACPTCLRPMDGLDYAERLKEIDGHIEELAENKEELSVKSNALLVAINKLKNQKTEAELSNRDQLKKKAKLESEVKRFKALKKAYDDSLELENPYFAKRDEEILKQKQIKEKLELLESKMEKIDEDIPYYSFWEHGFGDAGIKSFVFDLVCSSLTTKANKYLNILTNGSVLISFDTQQKTKKGDLREKFDCEIITDKERVDYLSYSGGEKRRISLAVDMALSELMSDYYKQKFSIVVHDEQDFYMDELGRESYLNLLKEMSKDRGVYVVAHDIQFKSKFDKIIKIVKRDKVSRIV